MVLVNGRRGRLRSIDRKEKIMAGKDKDSVYKVVELVGTSTKSWEDAAKNAVDVGSAAAIYLDAIRVV